MAERVDWLGVLSPSDVARELARASLFIFPSLTESFGLPLAEAMAAGLPIVTSDRAWAREVCGSAAVYVDPDAAPSLADAVNSLLRDDRARSALGIAGLRRARELTWNAAFDRYLNLLEAASS